MDVSVTRVETSDADQIEQLWEAVFGYKELRNQPNKVLSEKLAWDGRLLVAKQGDLVVGTIMFGYDGHRGWLYRLAVRADNRRSGIGRVLVQAAEAELRALGCTKVNLQLHAHNEQGVLFWQALGYGREVRISMGKDLTGAVPPGCDAGC